MQEDTKLKAYRREYYIKNRDRILAKNKEYYKTYEGASERIKENSLRWAEKNRYKKLFVAKKSRAKRNGIEFTILLEEIDFPEYCPILKLKLNYSVHTKDRICRSNSPSFDRIDPSLGYISGNVQIVSMLANMMKSYATKENLISFANWVNQTYGESK